MNKTIKSYLVVGERQTSDAVHKINLMIKAGWQPYGDPIVTVEDEHNGAYFEQVMVEYEDTKL